MQHQDTTENLSYDSSKLQNWMCIRICNSYNIAASALPDIYAQYPSVNAYISGKARVPVL